MKKDKVYRFINKNKNVEIGLRFEQRILDYFEIGIDKKGNEFLKYKGSKKLPEFTKEEVQKIIKEALELKRSRDSWKKAFEDSLKQNEEINKEWKTAYESMIKEYEEILDYIDKKAKKIPNLKFTVSRAGLERKRFFDSVIEACNKYYNNNLRQAAAVGILSDMIFFENLTRQGNYFLNAYFNQSEINSIYEKISKLKVDFLSVKHNKELIKYVKDTEGFYKLYTDLVKYRKKNL